MIERALGDFEIEEIYKFYSKLDDKEIFLCALNLSLYICYYLTSKGADIEEAQLLDSATMNTLIICMGVMYGVAGANAALYRCTRLSAL